jgi:hypothetical protein
VGRLEVGAELLRAVEVGGEMERAEHVHHGDDRLTDDHGDRGLTQQQRHGVPSRLAEQDRLRSRLDVDRHRDLGLDTSAGLHLLQPRLDPVKDRPVVVRVLRPLALDEAPVGSERLRRLGRCAALHPAQHHGARDHSLERAPVARDEAVDELGREARRQLGAPPRQQFVQDSSGGHGSVLVSSIWYGGLATMRPICPPASSATPAARAERADEASDPDARLERSDGRSLTAIASATTVGV